MASDPSWQRISAIFEQALERPRSERTSWVKEACGGDAALLHEVGKLLAAHDRAEGVLDQPVEALAARALDDAHGSAAPEEQVGRYRIVGEIGRGGMGVVYKAEDPRLGRSVALKFLPPYLNAHGKAKQRFLSEARAVSALDHPNICTIYDMGETEDGRLFFAMACYDGQTLAERIPRGPLPLSEAVEIAIQIARGLAHAHEAGIVHRDIKPSNVFLTAGGGVKILDFGLAKRGIGSLTESGTRLGTVAYMSPEQALGKKVDHRTDIWSTGIVFYEMLAGTTPFAAEYEDAVLYSIVHENPKLSPTATTELSAAAWQQIVKKALEKTPEHRYQRMRDMMQDLAALKQEMQSASKTPQPAGDRRPAPVAGVVEQPVSRGTASPSGSAGRRKSVGRQKELAELRAAFEGCASGGGLVLCVAGEPGMGKTTLVEDFLSDLAAGSTPCFIARGRCSERLAGTEAYLPILEALESLLQSDARELMIRLMKEKAPTWYVRVAPVPAASDPSFAEIMADAKVASQARMKRELNAFLQELSAWRPVVIFCDDLHWADVSTVDLLSYIGGRCDSMRVLVLAAYRPSDLLLVKHPFLQVKRELQGRGLCHEVGLEFLGETDIANYVNLEFPDHYFPSFFSSAIRSKTEGNPLFMVDLLRDLRDRAVIVREEGHWVLAQSVLEIQRDLPESIRGMIERKIERLDDADRRLLVGAAVQGQEFDSATIGQALGVDVAEVEERLEHLGKVHRFVRFQNESEFPDGTLTQRYSFIHVLYQNALYATLRTRQKTILCTAIGEALLKAHGDESSKIASDLAYLFEDARQYERAADFFLAAAENAASVYANQEAKKLALRAVANAEKLQGEARLSRVLAAANRLGQLDLTLSQIKEAVEDFQLAENAAAELGDVEAQVNAICAGALACFNLKRMEESRERAARALEIARSAGSETAAASAQLVLGLERMCFGDTAEAEQSFEQSVPVLRQKGAPLHALEAIGFAGLLHAWKLDYEEADYAVGWTLQKARDLAVPYHIIMNLFVRGMAKFNQGRLSEGLSDLREGMRLAELTNERYWLSRYPNTLGWAYRELQEAESAIRFNLEGAQVARENGYGKPEANCHVNLANLYLEVGECQRAYEHLRQAEGIFEQDLWFRWRYNIRLKAEMARYWLRRGETKKAREYAAESLALAEPRMARKHMAWAHKLLGDVAVAEERFDDARREYLAALHVLRRHHCPTVEWKILLAAAQMAGSFRDTPLAERYRGRCHQIIHSLADSLTDEKLKRQFLKSEAISLALA